jgi:hypothetical protein
MEGHTREIACGVIVAVLLAAGGVGIASGTGTPRVTFVQRAPLAVSGRGFGGHERLRLVVRGHGREPRRSGRYGRHVRRPFPFDPDDAM